MAQLRCALELDGVFPPAGGGVEAAGGRKASLGLVSLPAAVAAVRVARGAAEDLYSLSAQSRLACPRTHSVIRPVANVCCAKDARVVAKQPVAHALIVTLSPRNSVRVCRK